MSTQTEKVKNQVANAKPQGIRELIMASTKELGKALPSHMNPERMVRIALTTLRTTPKLMDCSPESFLAALFQSAQLGLEPNIEGQAYIIPYKTEATFQVGYKGFVELFYRHEKSVSLDSQEVCENDDFDYEYGTESFIRHKPALKDRGVVIAYYAVAKLKGGATLFKVMSKEECIKHGKRHSKLFNRPDSPWQKEPAAMCKKTVVIQIMKLIPKSIEIQKAIAMDNTIKSRVAGDMFAIKDETDWAEPEKETIIDVEQPTEEPKAEERADMAEEGEKTAEGDYEPISSKSEPTELRADILTMLALMDRSLLDYTKSENYAGTDDVNKLKDTISEGKKKSQLQVQHNILKADYKVWKESNVPEVDVEDDGKPWHEEV